MRIFPHSDWIRTRKYSVFGHISRSGIYICYSSSKLLTKTQLFGNICVKFILKNFTKLTGEQNFCRMLCSMFLKLTHCFMDDVEKWPNMRWMSWGVHTVNFLKYVWWFYNIMHERVKGPNSRNWFRCI